MRHFSRGISSTDADKPIKTPDSKESSFGLPRDTQVHINRSYYEQIRDDLKTKLSVASQFRNGLLMTATFLVVVGGILFIFKDNFRTRIVNETTQITKRSLEDDKIQNQVNQISQDTVNKILQDEVVYDKLVKIIQNLCKDQQVTIDISDLLKKAISTEEFRATLLFLLKDLVNNPETQILVNKAAKGIVEDLLRDEKLKRDLIVYCQSVLNDPELQKSMSDSAWKAFKITIIPSWFR